MILPTKHLSPSRALLTVAGEILKNAPSYPVSSGQMWERLLESRRHAGIKSPITFDWYVLALDVLYYLGLLDSDGDLLIVQGRHD